MTQGEDPDDLAGLVEDVRLLISDLDIDNGQIFDGPEIERFLALRGHDVHRAAATALRAIAASEALLLKVMTLQDIRTDGAALSRELRQLATSLEDQAGADEDLVVAEYAGSPFGWRRRLTNELLREAGE